MGFFDNLFGGASAKNVSDNFENGADNVPDTPLRFGYKSTWLCVRSNSPEDVIAKLGLKNAVKCSWKYGFEYLNEGTFVSPVLDGWVLVIGWGYDIITENPARLSEVGAMFPEAQYFSSHRVADYYAWVKFVDGVKVRSYCYCGGEGEVYENIGELTPREKALGLDDLIPSTDADWDEYEFSDEENVVAVAAGWGIDPLGVDRYPASTGYFCKF